MTTMHEPAVLAPTPRAHYSDDEIDLFELLQDLWLRKWWLVGSCVVALLLAVGYLLMVPSVYQVQSNIEAAAPQDMSALVVPGVNYELTPEEALGQVQQRLASWGTRKAFFLANPTLFAALQQEGVSPEQAFESFDRQHFSLHLAQTGGKNLSIEDRSTYIRLTYPEKMNGVAITNGLMAYAIAAAQKDVIAAFKGSVYQQKATLHHQIATLRNTYLGQLRYRQSRLTEALAIARQLGIKKTAIPPGFGGVTVSNTFRLPQALQPEGRRAPSDAGQRLDGQSVPLYYLGSEALDAQLKALKQQLAARDAGAAGVSIASKSFANLPLDGQIEGLYKLKQEGRYLASINPDFSGLTLVDVTRQASTPTHAVKPRKLLVLALALLLGLMLGCAWALLSVAWSKRQAL